MARALLAAYGLGASCVAVVEAPPPPAVPVEVFLVHEGLHKGLVLPDADGALIEWGFGDYGWYALERNAWYDAFATVFWPSRGTLGRRVWTAAERAQRRPQDVLAFRAEAARVAALAARLQADFERHRAGLVWNANYRTEFVPHARDYWLFHDCHDATAGWLAELGCEVEWALVRLDLLFREPLPREPDGD